MAERKLASNQVRKASNSDCQPSIDMSSPRLSTCSKRSSSSSSNSRSCKVAKGNDKQSQYAVSPAVVQHPADEACGGSFSLEEPAVEADVKDSQDSRSVEVRTGMAREIAEPEHHLANVGTELVVADWQARAVQGFIHSFDLHPKPQPPDAAAGGPTKMALSLPSTWCVMDEYDVLPPTKTQLPVAGLGRTWMHDMPKCAICTADFGPITRRHHCRKCGRNVCNVCSPFRVHLRDPIAHPSKVETGPHRICIGCHEPC